MSETIEVNGEREALSVTTLSGLLDARGITVSVRGVAIALNGAVVPRTAWTNTPLHAGDTVEIVHAKQGG